jgi:hypothetical protein
MALLEHVSYSPGEPVQSFYDKFNALVDAFNLISDGNKLAVKEIAITNWDMRVFNLKQIPHSLDFTKITRVWYVVVSDDLTLRVLSGSRDSSGKVSLLSTIDDTNVSLWHESTDFISTSWDAAGARGTLYIEYLK